MNRIRNADELLSAALEWIFGSIGILGSLHCLCSAFSLTAPELLFVPLLLPGILILFRLRRGGWIAAGTGLLLLAAVWFLRRPLLQSATELWNVLAYHYGKGYNLFNDLIPELSGSAAGVGPALTALALLQTYLTAVSLSCWRRAFPACLGMLLGVVPCYVLTDTYPDLLPLTATLLSILVLILTQNTRRRQNGELAKTFGWMTLVAAVILGGLLLLFPFQKKFEPPLTWADLQEQIERLGANIENRNNVEAGLSGNPNEVSFSRLRDLPSRATDVMKVRTDYMGVLYLRGASYNLFDGMGWARDELAGQTPSVLYPYLDTQGPWQLEIQPLMSEGLYYTAYEVTDIPAAGSVQGDSFLANQSPGDPYTLRFNSNPVSEPAWPGDDYDRYVRRTCLELPERTRAGVLAWWEEQGGAAGEESRAALARRAAELVSRCAVYSRKPDRLPAGKDFCTWFLSEAESGYCVHYASACTALLRALGIPARYVSGYVCQTSPGTEVTVTSLLAHAWVEYYDGGCWHRLEPTPGDATEFTGRLPERDRPTEPATRETTQPEPTKPAPSAPTEPAPTEPTQAPTLKQDDFTLPGWVWIPVGLVGLILLMLLRRAVVLRLRDRRYARADVNEKAVLTYRSCRELSRHSGTEVPEQALALAKKARFSQYEISRKELEFLRLCEGRQRIRLREAPAWKRLYYKYVLAIF